MSEISASLNNYSDLYGIEISKEQLDKFELYKDLLLKWNKKFNLTAITDEREIAEKHFLDSIIIMKYHNIMDGSSIVDVGSGAGFPGIPLAIMNETIGLSVIEASEKRLAFLEVLARELGISIKLNHIRAEDAGKTEDHRENYDYAFSRAVAPLGILSEYCMPLIKNGGQFLALKGKIEDELESSYCAIETLGGKVSEIYNFNLPGGGERSIIMIEKTAETPSNDPRRASVIKRKPL